MKIMDLQPEKLWYLASPYSHEYSLIREQRYLDVCRVASRLMRENVHVFSPIAHTHSIAKMGGLPTGWDFWHRYDKIMLDACYGMIIVPLKGWAESKGVKGEIELTVKMKKPIYKLDTGNWELEPLILQIA